MSSFVGSTLYFTMTSLWSTLEHQETAPRSEESMYNKNESCFLKLYFIFIHIFKTISAFL